MVWSPSPMVPINAPTDHGDGTETVRLRHPDPLSPGAGAGLVRLRFTQRP
jgi:hypothetical protein